MKSGLLRKKSTGWFPRWQTRHVTHSPDRTLTVKRHADSTRCRLFTVSSVNRGKDETELSVTCEDGRILCLRGSSKSEREDWIAALTACDVPALSHRQEEADKPVAHIRPQLDSNNRINGIDHEQVGTPHPSKSTAVEPANSLIASGREFRVQFYEQGQFVGEFLKGLRHGMGRFEYKNGNLYTGAWQNDVKCGFGTLQWANKDVYTGEWKNNKMWGYGQYQYADGNSYTGAFVSDNKHGPGRFSWVIGDTYEGEWQDDSMHGEGVMRYKNGNVFSGTLHKNVKHGRGKMVWSSGDCYEGEWDDGYMHGKGNFRSEGHGDYEGEWVKDKRHGSGRVTLANGDVFTGLWSDDVRNGAGNCKYANDDTYVGNFVNNLREGSGVYTAAPVRMLNSRGEVQDLAGDQYTGSWVGDKKHGYGRYVWTDGDVYEGEWDNDKRSQQGTCVYANGDKYTGEWLNDQRHGMGKLVWNDGNTYEGLWLEDNIAPGGKIPPSSSWRLVSKPTGAVVHSSPASSYPPSTLLGSTGDASDRPSPLASSASASSSLYSGYVPNLQQDDSDFDLAGAAVELAGNWFDSLTRGRSLHPPAVNHSLGARSNALPSQSPSAQLHMF